MPKLRFVKNANGLPGASFTDLNGSTCDLQMSSVATEPAIWLGVRIDADGRAGAKMLLNKKQVSALLPALKQFTETEKLK